MRAVLAALLVVLAAPGAAAPVEVTRPDAQGRTIHFDVRVEGAPVDWFAGVLRRSVHGDEISAVTFRLVSRGEVRETCGRGAAGCYRGGRDGAVVVVPARRDPAVAHTLLHEYGHHVDRTLEHGHLREPNGGGHWWRARGMGNLFAARAVTLDYDLGWERSVGEIFAEDYARANGVQSFNISWLRAPDGIVRRAILADMGRGAPPPGLPRKPQVRPFVLERSGTLAAGGRATLRFGLLGPGRRVILFGRLDSGEPGAKIELRCGSRVVTRPLVAPEGRTVEVPGLGPSRPRQEPIPCTATLVNATTTESGFALRVQVKLPG